MDLQDQQGSPYIRGMGVVPPSPDHNHRTTELESSFDGGSPNFIDASGSFNNSPYSNHSELSFVTAEGDLGGSGYDIFVDHSSNPQGLFDGLQSAGLSAGTDYDPADYDGPSSASSLLMFSSDHDYMSPSFHHGMASPDLQGHHRQGSVPFDHSSPSSNGDPQDRRSRASSISSSYQGQQPSAHFNHSPRLDVAHSFENMTVRSPNWGTEGLPSQPKPQSPPRLMMPDNYGMENTELPTINAPEGDGVGGPQLHIVPATPVGTVETGAPFNNAMRQGSDQRGNWLGQSQGVPSEPNSRQHSPYHLPVQLEPTTSQDSNFSNASSEFLFPQQRTRTNSGNAAWDQGMQHQQHLQRGVDGSGLGLDLDPMGHGGNLDDGVLGSGSSTTSINMSSPPNSGGSPSFNMQNFTFGGNSNANLNANRDSNSAFLSPNNNDAFMMRRSKSDQPNARSLGHRQSRSEDIRGNGLLSAQQQQQQQQQIAVAQHAAQQQQAGWAQGQQQTFATGGGGGGTHSHPHSPYHGHSLSLSASSGQMLFPPNQNDFDNNLLVPTQRNQRSMGHQGHIRRASSGSRSERGVGSEPWLTAYSGGSARASPYPSPNASPRVQYNTELELDLDREAKIEIPAAGNSAGFENEVALTGRVVGAGAGGAGLAGLLGPGGVGGHATHSPKSIDVNDFLGNASVSALNTLSAHSMSLGGGMHGGGGMGGHGHHGSVDHKPPSVHQVSKPNVTTLRTANASHRRRKQDAGFVCPFPGCGSTFTRSFNLKGHIRSHNEEKPFVCHWPGCGKGFARQHDCKRHEQLHTNYRPFTCEGCNRQFARMDALNRHLRSDGGAECAKLQGNASQQGTPDPSNNSDRATPATTASPSPRPANQSLMSSPSLDGGGLESWGAQGQGIGVSL